MIVQTAPPDSPADAPRFVMRMTEHTAFAGELARAFGNDRFEPVQPRDEMLYVVDHHDEGWVEFDRDPGRDPDTGLPWHLIHTPRDITLETGKRSPAFNAAHHPYAGLLASMHIWGLYNGRYGYSDQVLINQIPEDYRPRFEAMLDGQLAHQEALKQELREDPATAPWVEDGHLFQNYKQLQFFDTLALYFHCNAAARRQQTDFLHVPMTAAADTTVTVTPVDAETYAFDPFPWREDGVELSFQGRYMSPAPAGADLGAAMGSLPVATQRVRFVAG